VFCKSLTTTKEDLIELEKENRQRFHDWANENFEEGHMDPELSLSLENTTMQPASINRSNRNNHKFSKNGLPLCPTAEELIKNIDKYYPRTEEQEVILKFLRIQLEQ